MLFLLLIMVVPPLILTIIGWIDNERDYRDDLCVSKVLFFVAYFLTPLTAKIKKFGRLNKWGRFFIICMLMSFVWFMHRRKDGGFRLCFVISVYSRNRFGCTGSDLWLAVCANPAFRFCAPQSPNRAFRFRQTLWTPPRLPDSNLYTLKRPKPTQPRKIRSPWRIP